MPNWTVVAGRPRRAPPAPNGMAASAKDARTPALGWGPDRWPSDMTGICHLYVQQAGVGSRHGDYCHLENVSFVHPCIIHRRDTTTGHVWFALAPHRLVILNVRDSDRFLVPPRGTHVTIGRVECYVADDTCQRMLLAAQRALQNASGQYPPHLLTSCSLPVGDMD